MSTTTRAQVPETAAERARSDYNPGLLAPNISDEALQGIAREAARRLQRMLPGLRSFARIMTRDPKVHVVMRPGVPSTDGQTIYLRPPIELGLKLKHGRNCGERDERLVLVCEACRVTEDVEVTLYHEVAHIAFGSFAALDDHDRREVLERCLRERAIGTEDDSRARRLARRLDEVNPRNYIAASRLISPYLKLVVNALEDARVNTEMYRSRPGTYKMFVAQNRQVFEKGRWQEDGTVASWREMPLNAQAIVGLFAKASGLDYASSFHQRVVEALDTPAIGRICDSVATARSIRTIYRLALAALEELRKLGFCRLPDEPEDRPSGGADGAADDGENGSAENPDDEAIGSDAGGDEASDPADDRSEGGEPFEPGADDGDSDAGEVNGHDQASDDVSDTKHDPSAAGSDDCEKGEDTASDCQRQDDDRSGAAEDSTDESSSEADGETAEDVEGEDDLGEPDDEDADQGSSPGPTHTEDSYRIEVRPRSGFDDFFDALADDEDERGQVELPMGDPDEAEEALRIFGGHDEDGGVVSTEVGPFADYDDEVLDREVDRAIIQGEFFDGPSSNIWGVNEHRWGAEVYSGGGYALTSNEVWPATVPDDRGRRWGFDVDVDPRVLAPALARARVVFADNRKARRQRNLKAGKISPRVLGRRVPVDDPRLFARKVEPDAKDYFVLLGLDTSGSTTSGRLAQIKAAGLHMAELLNRLGVAFAIYGHTGSPANYGPGSPSDKTMNLDIVVIKDPHERWTPETRERLVQVCPFMGNLDGHTLEYYRKVCDRQQATAKLVLYFTDGAMPAANYDEELEILQREIRDAPRRGITIVGIGVGTDSPTRHGLDTLRLDDVADVPNLVRDLERRLTT